MRLQKALDWFVILHALRIGMVLTGSDRENQEVSVLALHLLQSALVHVNTLLLQQVLADPEWSERMTEEDRRALSPLFWAHVNPYGRFVLDMDSRLDLAAPTEFPGDPPSPLRDATMGEPL